MHIFTSVTANYIPKARVLAHSLKKHHPNAKFYLVLSDAIPEWIDKDEPFDKIITSDQLTNIPDFKQWAFSHSVVELCTAVKGFAFQHILNTEKCDHLFYFDPDIAIFSKLDELFANFKNAEILLTPHQCVPESDNRAIIDNEICSLKHGVFNLGFLGILNKKEGSEFIDWWAERLRLFCKDDIPGGLFTDQRWVDLAPCFFDKIKVLRDPQYNVCTWNISNRKVEGDIASGITVNNKPLCFYHFSGFDSGAQEIMLNVYGQNNPGLLGLRSWYIEKCKENGQEKYGKWPSIYHHFDNGQPITNVHRHLYAIRSDLQKHFADPFKADNPGQSYYHWFEAHARQEHPELFTDSKTQKNDEQHDLRKELAEIKNSRSWKLVQSLKKIKSRICASKNILMKINT